MKNLSTKKAIILFSLLFFVHPAVAAPANKAGAIKKKRNRLKTSAEVLAALSGDDARLQVRAAKVASRKRMIAAAPALRTMLKRGGYRAQITALAALVRLKDQQARRVITPLLAKRRLARRAENALRRLDRALGRPKTFLIIARPNLGDGVKSSAADTVNTAVWARVKSSAHAVVSGGEERVLSKSKLKRHLRRRRLVPMELLPHLKVHSRTREGKNLVFRSHFNLLLTSFGTRRMDYSTWGRANAALEGDGFSDRLLNEQENDVLVAAVGAAVEDVAEYLRRKSRRR